MVPPGLILQINNLNHCIKRLMPPIPISRKYNYSASLSKNSFKKKRENKELKHNISLE
jgi:hypothetical protein